MQQNSFYSLTSLNTFGLPSQAKHLVQLDHLNQLPVIGAKILAKYDKFLILGGGSNIILPEIYSGLVIYNQLKGIEILSLQQDSILVKAMAGENWDSFVAYTLAQGWFGLENLSLIPGSVGATPIQNIGAYGVEVKDFIEYVEAFDIKHKIFIKFSNLECKFSYRNSYFKTNPNYIVTAVVFRLSLTPRLNITYADIAKQMLPTASALDLRCYIIKTRQSKLPNPALIGNVGSFFHNPIVPINVANYLKQLYPNLPIYPLDLTQAKVSAGWLIDNLGLKGYRQGNVGVYDKQALVLVNHGNATQAEVLALAKTIQNQVFTHYQIKLNIEPIIITA